MLPGQLYHMVQDPVDNSPAVLVKRYNITETMESEHEANVRQTSLERQGHAFFAMERTDSHTMTGMPHLCCCSNLASLPACLKHIVKTVMGGSPKPDAAHTNSLLEMCTLHASKFCTCMRKKTVKCGDCMQAK